MKKNVIIGFLSLLLLGACETSQQSLSSVDDVYAVPSEIRAAEKAAADKARQEELAQAEAAKKLNPKVEDADDPKYNDPKYQDPQYSADDYYDYAYSSRLNRFHHPMGLGYYDSYYTNMYTYTGNPAFYGSSIYAGSLYNYPAGYGSLSFGYGSTFGYGGYGYNSPYYDPWMSAYYSPYSMWPSYGGMYGYTYTYGYGYNYGYYPAYNSYWSGYNAGFNAGFNNGRWGYFNSCDANSGYSQLLNAPRESHGGGIRNPSEGRRAGEASSGGQRTYLEEVAAQQQNRQRFSSIPNDRVMNRQRSETTGSQRQNTAPATQPNNPSQEINRRGPENRNDGRVMPNKEQQTQPQRRETPVFQPSGGDGGGGRRGGDGGSSPRNTGGGGGGRPR